MENEKPFKLVSKYRPTGDQPEAIDQLVKGLENGVKEQVLMGVTGSGKTFTMANVIEQMNLPKDTNGNVSFSVEDLMPFSTAVSNARTMSLLRKYHEWANAEERELL